MGLLRYIEDNQWERVGLSKIACAGEGGRERKWGASCVVWGLVAREGRQCGGALVKTSEANKTGGGGETGSHMGARNEVLACHHARRMEEGRGVSCACGL